MTDDPVVITTDFCIVGGGPAGLTLALLLLRSGAAVTVVERSASLDREYRGEVLQPGGLAVLDQMGVLKGAVARGAYPVDRFQVLGRKRKLLDIGYQRLPAPHNHLLSIPQRHVLEELLDGCRRFERFRYLDGVRATRLTIDGARVTGAVGEGGGRRHLVRAHCVVGADGRFSKVRRLAGIDYVRRDVFDFDVLWFRFPSDDLPEAVQVYRVTEHPILIYPSYPGTVQLGYILPHKGYTAIVARGIDHVREEICRAVPPYADQIRRYLRDVSDMTLLDVFSGTAREWVRDGLVLIGDSAHTHSPLGAQGINLAIQDAALLHPVLMSSLDRGPDAAVLSEYATPRMADIEVIMKIQTVQAKAMLSQGGAARVIRPVMARLIQHTPVGAQVTRRIAYGRPGIDVRSDLFTTTVQARLPRAGHH